ncbi:hypothetical protein [Streptomyces sp. NPDC002054]|uniref:restriction system modified-DNA reader domain-containing protein n=1 Tax=Streptomyces sp. NPDC002054 TaxID=3154663 RepID=UPI003321E71D
MDRTIQVDEEVYTALQLAARPFIDTTPNSVLRRLLGLDDEERTDTGTAAGPIPAGPPEPARRVVRVKRRGGLLPLIESGRLRANQRLVWKRRNHGEEYHATVLANGEIRLEHDNSRHRTPSSAAASITGYQINGWNVWETEQGEFLAELRG